MPSFQVVEVDPFSVTEAAPADPSRVFVYDHLKRVLSKDELLPAIAIELSDNRLVCVSRSIYLRAARDLGRDRIRAILRNVTFDALLKASVPGILRLVPAQEVEDELNDVTGVREGRYFVFLCSQPDETVIARVLDTLRAALIDKLPVYDPAGHAAIGTSVEYDPTGPCIEMSLPMPRGESREWASALLSVLMDLHQVVPISSFQGQRWQFP